MNGYDIDGVLTSGIQPELPYVIISGRTLEHWHNTVIGIGIFAPIYLMPNKCMDGCTSADEEQVRVGMWKSEMINKIGVTKFYEDIPLQAKTIEENTTGCEVVLVVTN